MNRQLYYLLPDVPHTRQLCDDVTQLGVPAQNMHAIVDNSLGGDYDDLKRHCTVNLASSVDREFLLEWTLWRSNLLLFFLSFLALIVLLLNDQYRWIIIPLAIMVVTFSLGYYFVWRMPNLHWRDCLTAIKHGEVLLSIELPKKKLRDVDQVIHRRHPEAVGAGVGWKI